MSRTVGLVVKVRPKCQGLDQRRKWTNAFSIHKLPLSLFSFELLMRCRERFTMISAAQAGGRSAYWSVNPVRALNIGGQRRP